MNGCCLSVNSPAAAARRLRPGLARLRVARIGHIGQHFEEVALLRLDDLLHLGQRLLAETAVGQIGYMRRKT